MRRAQGRFVVAMGHTSACGVVVVSLGGAYGPWSVLLTSSHSVSPPSRNERAVMNSSPGLPPASCRVTSRTTAGVAGSSSQRDVAAVGVPLSEVTIVDSPSVKDRENASLLTDVLTTTFTDASSCVISCLTLSLVISWRRITFMPRAVRIGFSESDAARSIRHEPAKFGSRSVMSVAEVSGAGPDAIGITEDAIVRRAVERAEDGTKAEVDDTI
mmetsp:Transcript_76339/g.218560  ORF Transcript_76339/g.218560 Transcript_76339/m.218560 type:complete len:214 (+) Transcript_76339:285-926(+)